MDKDELRWERYQFPGKFGSKKIHSHLLSNQKKSAALFSDTLNHQAVGVVARNRINFKAKIYKT